jgi:cyanophycinase-like exopeptidase
MPPSSPKGTLIIIGGHEDKDGDAEILHEVAARTEADGKRLVVITVAARRPGSWPTSTAMSLVAWASQRSRSWTSAHASRRPTSATCGC